MMRKPGHLIGQGAGTAALAACCLLLGWTPPPATAQPAPAPGTESPVLTVTSDPSGAVVTLRGPYEWVGTTPWSLYRSVSGLYRIEARLPGYESWKSEIVLGEGGIRALDIRLGRKTTAKAFMRSMLIPGWGQFYRGSKTKGAIFLTGTVAAGVAFLFLDHDYQKRVDTFNDARDRYEAITNQDELAREYAALRSVARKADNAWDDRQIAVAALGGIYAIGLLDVLLFGPSGEVNPGGTTAAAAAEDGGMGMAALPQADGSVRAALRWTW